MVSIILGPLILSSIVLNKGIKNENKVVAHIAVLLTLIMIPGLLMPLKGAITRSDTYAILRVIIMMGSTIIAFLFFNLAGFESLVIFSLLTLRVG